MDFSNKNLKYFKINKISLRKTISIFAVIALLFTTTSCFFDGVKGNRNVVTEQRNISADFDAIDVSRGIDVYITIGDKVSLSVEADENLHDIISTEVKDGTLQIYAEKNIWKAKAKKIYVTTLSINEITTSSGAHVKSEDIIESEDLTIRSTSGSNVKLQVKVSNLICKTSSGADVKLKGTAETLTAKSSSGSSIRARDLVAKTGDVKATSGASVSVNVTNELSKSTNSGGSVTNNRQP